jgi:hypothetical protein
MLIYDIVIMAHTNRVWHKNISNSRDLTLDNLIVEGNISLSGDTIIDDGDLCLSRGLNTSSLTRTLKIEGARNTSGTDFGTIELHNLDSTNGNVDYIGAQISSQNDGGIDDGDLRFSTNDGTTLNEAMVITSDGYVGIGESAPTTALVVQVDDTSSATCILDNDGVGDAGLFLRAGSGSFQLAVDNSDDDNFKISSAGVGVNDFMIAHRTTGNVEFSLGNVGVGIAVPATNLHVYENSDVTNTQLRLENEGTGDCAMTYTLTGGQSWATGIDNSDGDKFKINNTTVVSTTAEFVIDTSGNVGIGIQSPLTKLHVYENGNITSIVSIEQDGTGDAVVVYNLTGEQLWSQGVDNTDNFFKINSSSALTSTSDFTITTAGDVGIGPNTNSPAEKLDVQGNILLNRSTATSALTRTLCIQGARSATGTAFAQIDFENIDNDSGNVNYGGARIQSQNDTGADTGDLRFSTNNGTLTQHMIIDSDGMTTITQNTSTETPQLILENDGSGDTGLKFSVGSVNTDNIIMGQNNSITGDPFVMGIGDTVGASGPFFGYLPTNNYVSVVSSVFNHSFRVGIDDAAKPSTSTWTVISDRRFKTDIKMKSLIECQDFIKRLALKKFVYTDDFVEENKVENNDPRIGFIAQEVQELVKATFNKDDDRIVREVPGGKEGIDPYLTLNVDQINMQLIGAVQQLIKRVDRLERKNTALESKLKLHIEEENVV